MKIVFEGEGLADILRQAAQFFTDAGLIEVDMVGRKITDHLPPQKAKAPEPEPQPQPQQEEEDVKPEAKEAIDLLALKNQQLDRLRELFNAGKGTFVRELLAKYGHGAKVFPEVEAKYFPAIKIDIDRELN